MHELFPNIPNIMLSRKNSIRPDSPLAVCRSFLSAEQGLQEGVLFTEVRDFPSATLGLSNISADRYMNTLTVKDPQNFLVNLSHYEDFITNHRGRTTAIYINGMEGDLKAELTERGYEKRASEVWMKWNGGTIDPSSYEEYVDEVKTRNDLKTFSATLEDAHMDEESYYNPNGQISYPERKAIRQGWSKHQRLGHGHVRYYNGYDAPQGSRNRMPVSTGAVTSNSYFVGDGDTITGSVTLNNIANIATRRKARGKGHATRVISAIINEPTIIMGQVQTDPQIYTLVTAPESEAHHLYTGIGFGDLLTAERWEKREDEAA